MNYVVFKTFLILISFNFVGDQLLFSNEILISKDQSLSVEERYGDRIKLLGVSVKRSFSIMPNVHCCFL